MTFGTRRKIASRDWTTSIMKAMWFESEHDSNKRLRRAMNLLASCRLCLAADGIRTVLVQ